MVWGLFPADPLSGEDKYYIFTKGTYKVGRKGCDVIIKKDKGVSRIHAVIIVDGMTFLDPTSYGVRIKDCSKYGTFITKNHGSKEKIHEFEGKEADLKDGDLVSFGTGNATYRFSFVQLVFFFYCADSFQVNHLLRDTVVSIGAHIVDHFNEECTHIVVDELMPVTEDLFDAILSNKCVVLRSWIKVVAEKSISSELPRCSFHVPTLTLEGVSVKVVESRTRANCLEGYTCILDSTHKYKFGRKLQSLLQLGGANILFMEDICSSSQKFGGTSSLPLNMMNVDSSKGFDREQNNCMVCVIPTGSTDEFDHFGKLSSLCRVNEVDLLCAVLSGHLDSSILISPSVLVSSSCSTDETIVADSDVEMETATSVKSITNICSETCVEKAQTAVIQPFTVSEHTTAMCASDIIAGISVKRQKIDESESGNADIIYSQDLIARQLNLSTLISSADGRLPNFKCFRKKNTQSGNSFNNLIPFSKYPYKDSDYENNEMRESVKEERKRKQMEAIAEDLFNNEKGRRRGATGSLHGLLTRR